MAIAVSPSPRRPRASEWREMAMLGFVALAALLLAACGSEASLDQGPSENVEDEASPEDRGFTEQAVAPPHDELPRSVVEPYRSEAQRQRAGWLADLDETGRIGQLLMLRVFGSEIDEPDPRNEALYGVATPRELIETFRPGGIILFRTDAGAPTGNLMSPAQVRAFTDDLRATAAEIGPPLLIGIDQEGGVVDRIGHFGTPFPSARQLDGDLDLAAEHAAVTARELSALGIDVNFAPVADVDTEDTNPIIGDRAFSSDPDEVGDYVVTQLEAYAGTGVAAGLKHFPGHGDTTEDSHLTLPRVDADLDQLTERELVPFARAVEHGAEVIMTAHLELPEVSGDGVPTSMSKEVVTGLLREDLGFDGVIVTDSLEMAGARRDRPDERVAQHALQAGHDLLVLPPVPQESVARLERVLQREQIDPEQVDASVRRLLRLKSSLQRQLDERPDPEVVGEASDTTEEE